MNNFKKVLLSGFGIFVFGIWIVYEHNKAYSYHNFFQRNADDITTGTLGNARLDASSVTKRAQLTEGTQVLTIGSMTILGAVTSTNPVTGSSFPVNNSLYSTMVGFNNAASGTNSNAFGYINTVSSLNASGMGYSNIVSGVFSNAVGYVNTASGTSSNAVGLLNVASSSRTTAAGYSNTASSSNASAIGYANNASGANASALGYSNTASSSNSSALGLSNVGSNASSSGVGASNTASGANSSGVGNSNAAGGDNSGAVGFSNQSSGLNSNAFGYTNIARGTNSSAFGNTITISSPGVANTSIGYNFTTSASTSVVLGAVIGSQNFYFTVSTNNAVLGRNDETRIYDGLNVSSVSNVAIIRFGDGTTQTTASSGGGGVTNNFSTTTIRFTAGGAIGVSSTVFAAMPGWQFSTGNSTITITQVSAAIINPSAVAPTAFSVVDSSGGSFPLVNYIVLPVTVPVNASFSSYISTTFVENANRFVGVQVTSTSSTGTPASDAIFTFRGWGWTTVGP